MKVSAFVISYNSEKIIETCLRSLQWVDELIVIDKSSTDATRDIAAKFSDTVVTVPWTPVVEDTRQYALSLLSHDFIVFLDDDECLSPAAIEFLQNAAADPQADIFELLCRHYIMGVHDERACVWPELHIRAFKRGAVSFVPTVHASLTIRSDNIYRAPAASDICFHHFSHVDIASFIKKTNTYTSISDRNKSFSEVPPDLGQFAQATLASWLGKRPAGGTYTDSVAILYAIYDIVDALKSFEKDRDVQGHVLFDEALAKLRESYGPARRRRSALQKGLRHGSSLLHRVKARLSGHRRGRREASF